MRIIPAIDLIDGRCVRLTQGDYNQKTEYNASPVEVARDFEAHGFEFLHLVDLDGARSGKVTQWETIEEIAKGTGLKIDVGGGIKTGSEIERLFSIGASQVNVGSIAVKDPEKVYAWLKEFGPDRIILSADVRDEEIAIGGWLEQSGIDIYSFVARYVENGIVYVTCTDISSDGTLNGPGTTLYLSLIDKFPSLRLIASGGVGNVAHLEELKATGVDGVIVGKAIYENKISLRELSTF